MGTNYKIVWNMIKNKIPKLHKQLMEVNFED